MRIPFFSRTFNRIRQVPCEVAQSNKQGIETCLYHKRDRLTYDKGYKQAAKRIANIRFDTHSAFYLGQRSSFFASGANG